MAASLFGLWPRHLAATAYLTLFDSIDFNQSRFHCHCYYCFLAYFPSMFEFDLASWQFTITLLVLILALSGYCCPCLMTFEQVIAAAPVGFVVESWDPLLELLATLTSLLGLKVNPS